MKQTNNYIFILGREEELALAEMKAVLERLGFEYSISKVKQNVVSLEIKNFDRDKARELTSRAAGTVKIYQIDYINVNEETVLNGVLDYLQKEHGASEGKVNFGISAYTNKIGKNKSNKIGFDVKNRLKGGETTYRSVQLVKGNELTTIQVIKNKLDTTGVEFGIFDEGVGVLLAVNDPEKWAKIDYGKPESDKFSGMLPPKLARMMINLAIDNQMNAENSVIVDPFCGSGNVILETMQLGFNAIGSDIADKAVRKTKANMWWMKKEYNLDKLKVEIFKADATSDEFANELNNVIGQIGGVENVAITGEPYLGEPKKNAKTMKETVAEYEGIRSIYTDFLKNIAKIGKKTSICMVFPLVETTDEGKWSLYESLKEEIEKLGYKTPNRPIEYGREYQIVKREILVISR